MQLQLLTATVKLFLKKPTEVRSWASRCDSEPGRARLRTWTLLCSSQPGNEAPQGVPSLNPAFSAECNHRPPPLHHSLPSA